MKWSELFNNLGRFDDLGLSAVNIKGIDYRTNTKFKPSYIAGFCFGQGTGPNSYNERLAKAAIAARSIFGSLPTILQHEIYIPFQIENMEKSKKLLVDICDPRKYATHYITTRDAIKEAKEMVESMNLDSSKGLIIAHPSHMFRVIGLAKREGLNGTPFLEDSLTYPALDPHKWVTNPETNKRREAIVRIHHKLLGWI